jgi:2-dehydropantoate 2-reductase
VQEVVMVARACGVSMPEDLLEQILKIPTAMPTQMSSTAQDLARGKPSEIDFLNGRRARHSDSDQPCPSGDGEARGTEQ